MIPFCQRGGKIIVPSGSLVRAVSFIRPSLHSPLPLTGVVDARRCRRSTGFDEAAYLGCVKACALEQDFEEWPQGDRTIIGAKGVLKAHLFRLL